MRLALTAFTRRGYGLAHSLARALEEQGEEVTLALPVRLAQELGTASYECLTAWTGARFADCEGLLFVGACGIAVRAIAPWVRDEYCRPRRGQCGRGRGLGGPTPLRPCGRGQ